MEKWQVRSHGPWQILIDDDDFRRANRDLKRQKKEYMLRACGERRASQGRETDGTDLGYGCHKRTSEEYPYLSISSFCS